MLPGSVDPVRNAAEQGAFRQFLAPTTSGMPAEVELAIHDYEHVRGHLQWMQSGYDGTVLEPAAAAEKSLTGRAAGGLLIAIIVGSSRPSLWSASST